MDLGVVFLIGVGLSMDAFAAAICKGISIEDKNFKKGLIVSLLFGFFQMAMPVVGYFFGRAFYKSMKAYDHWIAFILLSIIGINMIKESREHDVKIDYTFDIREVVLLAIATSIDALAVGVSLAFLDVNIFYAAPIIGIITFVISLVGVKIGKIFGAKFKNTAELMGGLILIFLGVKILVEHLELF